jgi:outer membrane protein X
MRNIKNVFLVVIVFCAGALFKTTNGQADIGGGLNFGTEIENVGLHLRGGYLIQEKFHLGANFSFFFPKEEGSINTTWWAFNINGNYWYTPDGDLYLYPLVGLNIATIKVEGTFNTGFGSTSTSDSDTEIGINLGGGVGYMVNDNLLPFFEGKYVVSDFDQAVFSLGMRYLIR